MRVLQSVDDLMGNEAALVVVKRKEFLERSQVCVLIIDWIVFSGWEMEVRAKRIALYKPVPRLG